MARRCDDSSARPVNSSLPEGGSWWQWIFLLYLSRHRDRLIPFSNSCHSLPSNINANKQVFAEIYVKVIHVHSGADTRVPGIRISDRAVETERLRDAAILFYEH